MKSNQLKLTVKVISALPSVGMSLISNKVSGKPVLNNLLNSMNYEILAKAYVLTILHRM